MNLGAIMVRDHKFSFSSGLNRSNCVSDSHISTIKKSIPKNFTVIFSETQKVEESRPCFEELTLLWQKTSWQILIPKIVSPHTAVLNCYAAEKLTLKSPLLRGSSWKVSFHQLSPQLRKICWQHTLLRKRLDCQAPKWYTFLLWITIIFYLQIFVDG